MNEIENSVPSTEAEADALLASLESPSVPGAEDVKPEQGAAGENAAEQPPAVKPAAAPQLFKLSRKGLEKEFPLDKVLQFAQQGWDYNEHMAALNQRVEGFQTQQKEFEERFSVYKQLEDYIKKDPAWWDHIRSAYEQRNLEQGGNPASLQKVIQEQVSKATQPFKDFLESQEHAKHDQKLTTEITGYRERYPDFDWKTTDDFGRSVLEQKILAHAVENEIGSFRAAANDFLRDEIDSRNELKSREKVGQELKKQTKFGLGPVTNRPVTEIKRAKNVSASSYDEITDEAMRELGIA